MKLISSKEYGRTLDSKTDEEYRWLRDCYDDLLDQSLTLGMFAPTDEEGNVLDEPKEQGADLESGMDYRNRLEQYQKAKERVLFEGDLIFKEGPDVTYLIDNGRTIEYLQVVWTRKCELTPTALKQIGLELETA